jgi:hypothetical protein
MDKIEEARLLQLLTYTPFQHALNILYVGANRKRFHFRDYLQRHKQILAQQGILARVDIIEIDPKRASEIDYDNCMWVDKMYYADVQDTPFYHHYNAILWSHGPTILHEKDITSTLRALFEFTQMLIIMCPWGKYPEVEGQSEHDTNKTALYPDYFISEGFAVHTLGEPDVPGSNILAWKLQPERSVRYATASPAGTRRIDAIDRF